MHRWDGVSLHGDRCTGNRINAKRLDMTADLESFETCALREMYRNACKRDGEDSGRAGKMGRNELLSKLRGKRIDGVCTSKREPKKTQAAKQPKQTKLSDKIEECFLLLLEALRAYTKHAMLSAIGRRESPEAKVYLADARKLCQEAVGCAIDQSGNGWESANRVFNVVDRALLKLRNDFNDTLVSSCVMSSLLSEEHVSRLGR